MGSSYAPWSLLCAEQAAEKETRHGSCQQRSWVCATEGMQNIEYAAEVVFPFFSLFVIALFSDQYGYAMACFEKKFHANIHSCPKICLLITYRVEGIFLSIMVIQ